ncbi:MAG: hypothetical protein CMJ18_11425 [Phycisphaeraceae bacterium]|nr:hypothetical protein [Phycisphaeraceae bacterium]
MLLIRLSAVQPRMKLARPVLHPDRDNLILLNTDFELDEKMVCKLRSMNVTHVWIQVPGFEGIQHDVDENICRSHLELYQILNRSIESLEPRVAVKLEVSQYQSAVHRLLGNIIDRPHHDVVTNDLMMCGPQLAGHMANCSYLSLLLGAHLTGYLKNQRRALPAAVAQRTEQLGLGALLHDIGKLNMPDELRQASVFDDLADTNEYRMHARSGYEAVHELISPAGATVVLHHHERYDGTGFPGRQDSEDDAGIAGDSIHVFSRIVAVVDVFDRLLTHNGSIGPTIAAIRGIRHPRFNGWFDPTIVEALLRLVPPFMIGSQVRLSDGSEAAVVANHPEAPCRPTVRLIRAMAQGPAASDRQLDMRMCRDLHVAEVDGLDVTPYVYKGAFEDTDVAA